MPAEIRVHDQPQAGTEADGHTGAIWHGTRAEYQSSAPAAQGLPVLAQGRECDPPQSGVEYGHHLYPAAAWICVPGGRDRLVLAESVVMAVVEYAG